jgi:hypothetical protein
MVQHFQTFLYLALAGIYKVIIQKQYDIVVIPPGVLHVVFNLGSFGASVATNLHTIESLVHSFDEYEIQAKDQITAPYLMPLLYKYVERLLISNTQTLAVDSATAATAAAAAVPELEINESAASQLRKRFIQDHQAVLLLISDTHHHHQPHQIYNPDASTFNSINVNKIFINGLLVCNRCKTELYRIWKYCSSKNIYYCMRCDINQKFVFIIEQDPIEAIKKLQGT